MSAPSVIIVVRLEAAPIVMVDAMTEGQALRLDDWLTANEDIGELVRRARELERMRRAA